jgi:hypothetical protein
MPKTKYLGTSNERGVTKEQFEERGVMDQEDVFINTAESREVELSQAAADLLLMAEPKDWEIVEAAEEAAPEAAPKDAKGNKEAPAAPDADVKP